MAIATTCRCVRRNCAGDVTAPDLMKGRSLGESLHLAVGIRDRRAAPQAGGKTAVNPVPVGIVVDEKHAPLGLRATGQGQKNKKADQDGGHWWRTTRVRATSNAEERRGRCVMQKLFGFGTGSSAACGFTGLAAQGFRHGPPMPIPTMPAESLSCA